MELNSGEVWWAAPDPTVGREQSGRRPVVIVSGQSYLDTVTTLAIVTPVTRTDREWPNHIEIRGISSMPKSFAMTEQARTISRERLQARIGTLSPTCLEEIRDWVIQLISD